MALVRALRAMQARSIVAETSSATLGAELDAVCAARRAAGLAPPGVYAGFDPTGPSLHLGHLGVLLALKRLQVAGLRPVLLVGGATALIGDPTGKRADRPLLSESEVAANAASIASSVEKLFSVTTPPSPADSGEGAASAADPLPAPLLVNNADFYSGMGILTFMREAGRFARLSAMLAKDSVAARLAPAGQSVEAEEAAGSPASGLSFTEFSYQLFQAWDYWRLSEDPQAACVLQVGGADQWGNITAGMDLVRRKRQHRTPAAAAPANAQAAAQVPLPVHGLTVPLLTTSDGAKWGKSAGNVPVWLDERRTSHHALFQFLLATPDADVGTLLRRLTLIPEPRLEEVLAEHAAAPHAKVAQRALADAVTEVVRGTAAVQVARRCASILFAGSAAWAQPAAAGGEAASTGQQPAQQLHSGDLLALAGSGDLPSVALPAAEAASTPIVDLLVKGGLSPSKSEARRTIAAGGLQVNGARVAGAGAASSKAGTAALAGSAVPLTHLVTGAGGHFIDGAVCLLSLGARKRLVVVLGDAGAAPAGEPVGAPAAARPLR